MRGVNKVILVGTLGRDPELRYLSSGAAIANASLATSELWKDKQSGEKKEITEWHRVVFFGVLAEIAGKYAVKGSQLYVEGKLKTRKWQGQDGKDIYSTEIHAESIQLIGGNRAESHGNSQQKPTPAPTNHSSQAPQSNTFEDFDDDIPF